uniref:Uncharacterized protein n=1 Tax=Globisporangium ultimum (strain ATCC 200006 / CBS 805.95 / DAOM BR144) TaxID=431595 RepID=K3X3A5_GLOUD
MDAAAADAHDSLTLEDLTFFHALTTPRSSHESRLKRAWALVAGVESGDDGGTSEDSCSAPMANAPVTATRSNEPSHVTPGPVVKQRKRSHEMNREAKEKLQDELRYLEAHVALLRHEAGLVAPQVVESKRALGAKMRDAVLQQDLQFATMQSMFSGFTNSRVSSPLESYIHLTKDWQERCDTLLQMKDRKIDVAHRFLLERTRFMNPIQECYEQSQYVTTDGEFCTIRMDITPFERVTSVRQVFDAMQFYLMNMEITLTEMSGDITIRENDENTETTVLQHRLVTSMREGVLVEKNAVLFMDTSGLDFENAHEQSALIAVDFVDQDDLYPYCPSQRLRKDATCVMKLSGHRRNRADVAPSNCDNEKPKDDDELVVVLTRWFLVRLRPPEIVVPEFVVRSVADDLTGGVDHMIKTMREGVYPTKSVVL